MAVTEVKLKRTLWNLMNKIFILMTEFVKVKENFVILNGTEIFETTELTCCTSLKSREETLLKILWNRTNCKLFSSNSIPLVES